MRRPAIVAAAAWAILATPATAEEMGGHEALLFRKITAEIDYADRRGGIVNWDIDGWIGGDFERVWLRSEGEITNGETESAEAQLYYGWNVDDFWDVLVGLRQDFEPDDETYLAAGVVGLAPLFLETEATAFLSNDGDVSFRWKQSIDLPITQFLVAEPHLEVNAQAQDVPSRDRGEGLTDAELGLQLRYEITRKIAPYVDLVWERALGETAGLMRAAGEPVETTTLRIGLRVWF